MAETTEETLDAEQVQAPQEKTASMSMRRAALVQLGSKYASIVAQLLVTAVLARLISPAEFGTLAIVTVFTTFFTLFSDMGIGVAIVQFRDLTERDFGKLFGFSIVLAAGLTAAFCVAAFPISVVYRDPELVPLCMVASLSLLFATLNMVPNGIMLREKKFTQIGARLVVATVVSGIIGIALAVAGLGCYALVLQSVARYLVVLVWNLVSCPIHHVSLHFKDSLSKVFSYSAFQFASSLINYFNRNLDNLLIGYAQGSEALGFYDKAYKLTTYPMTSFSSVIASVVQPYMAEHQDDPDVIFDCWLRMAKLCSLIGAGIATIMFCCTDQIILIMYGDAWVASIPLLHALSVGVYAQMVGNPTGAFFQSLGRTDLMFRCSVANTAIMVAAILAGIASSNINLVAWFVSAAFFVQLISIGYYLLHRGFHKSIFVLRRFVPEIAAGVAASVATMLVARIVPQDFLIQLLTKGFTSTLVLLVLYGLTGQLTQMRKILGR